MGGKLFEILKKTFFKKIFPKKTFFFKKKKNAFLQKISDTLKITCFKVDTRNEIL